MIYLDLKERYHRDLKLYLNVVNYCYFNNVD